MSFERKNVVKDPSLAEAFKEGFREGQAMTEAPVYEVTVEFEGTILNRATYDEPVHALQAVAQAIATPGVKATIEVGIGISEVRAEMSASQDDNIIEAEVLEDE